MANAPLHCHLLVGLPGSGKSTFAGEWVKRDPHCAIVSTDVIRGRLYGDESIQGHWHEIEAEVLQHVQSALDEGRSVIYDATNVRRCWRLDFLDKVSQRMGDRAPSWSAWYLDVPIVTCKQRNHRRRRVIPTRIIDDMAEYLHQFEPVVAEGFLDVQKVPLDASGWFDLSEVFRLLDRMAFNVIHRRNRQSSIVWHPYAPLIDFERLMYVLAYLLHDAPQRLDLFVPLEDIATAIAQQHGTIYGQTEAVAADLAWLRENDFFDVRSGKSIEIEVSDRPEGMESHRHSDRDSFLRLLETIRAIVYTPFEKNPEQSVQESVVQLVNARRFLTDRNNLRKDLELVLYPYGILQRRSYRQGYYLGTSIFSPEDLVWLHKRLQQQEDWMSHPDDLETYHQILTRIERLNIPDVDSHTPTLRFGNAYIIEVEGLSNVSLARRRDRIERAIRDRELLSLKRLAGGGQFPGDMTEMRAYPLQLVFRNMAWYVGFEAEDDSLLSFERLDRWCLANETTSVLRDEISHRKAVRRLECLLAASPGMFLGRSAQAQRDYLSRDRARRSKVTVTVELWCNDRSFAFISEGTQRFPLKQMKMSPPRHSRDSMPAKLQRLFSAKRTGDERFPHRFQVKLPQWSIDDIDLQRWIMGFSGQVKVVEPQELREKILALGRAIVRAYEPDES